MPLSKHAGFMMLDKKSIWCDDDIYALFLPVLEENSSLVGDIPPFPRRILELKPRWPTRATGFSVIPNTEAKLRRTSNQRNLYVFHNGAFFPNWRLLP